MPQIRVPQVLDLPTPLTRRRQRARITVGLLAGLLAIPLALLVLPAPRTVPTASSEYVLPDDVALTETIPALVVGAAIVAEPSVATALPIHLTPVDSIPKDAWIRIASLPPLSSLSEGYEISPGLWGVPPAALPKLKITAPSGRGIRALVSVALMSSDGRVLAEAETVFAVMSAQQLLNREDAAPADPDTIEATATSQVRATGAAIQCPGALPATEFSYEQVQAARRLVEKGDNALADGAVAVARSFYKRAAEMGWSGAAFALATTYDPNELTRWPLGPSANLSLARCWYARAQQLSEIEATHYLKRLEPTFNPSRSQSPLAGARQ
jgi:hypothetical protein